MCTGVAAVALALAFRFAILPVVLRHEVHRLGSENLVIPNDTSSPRYKAFEGSVGQPPRFWKFYIYNLSHPGDVLAGGRPRVHLHGPYTYRETIERHSVAFSDDLETVSFDEFQQFQFEPAMSSGSESDVFTTPNVVYAAAAKVCQQAGIFSDDEPPDAIPNVFCNDGQANTCFFLTTNVTQHIWRRRETLINVVAGDWVDQEFQFFFNCSSREECRDMYSKRHYFGMGGACEMAQEHSNLGIDITSGVFVKFLGNESISFNYTSPKATFLPQEQDAMGVRGTDGTTFGPLLDKSSTLWVFEPDAMRSLPLVYSEPQTVLGLPAMRFVGRDDAFPDNGGINLTNTATIRYGQPAPVFATRLLFDRVDDPRAHVAICENCDGVFEGPLEPYVDVEPLTGVTLRGHVRVQMNIHVGQRDLFGSTNMSCFAGGTCPHAAVQDHFFPYVIIEKYAEMNQTQADSLLHDVYLVRSVDAAVFYGLLAAGAVLLVAGMVLHVRARRLLRRDQGLMQPLRPPGASSSYNSYGVA